MSKEKCYFCGKSVIESDKIIYPTPIKHTYIEKNEDDEPIHKSETLIIDRVYHHRCLNQFLKNKEREKLTKDENKDWDAVYQFFKHDILQMPGKTSAPGFLVQRLLGLRVGKFTVRGVNPRYLRRGYSFRTILYALKYSKRDMDRAIATVDFKDERHKINYLMSILTSNIDFIQDKVNKMDRQNRRIEKMQKEVTQRKPVEKKDYVRKSGGMNRFDWVE